MRISKRWRRARRRRTSSPPPAIGTAGLFLKANSSLVGPSEGVAIRFPERRNEHEVELAMVFGKEGSDIPRDKALDYVIGYSIGLDMTARGPEDRSFRKSIDTYSVLGYLGWSPRTRSPTRTTWR
jgi:2,4-didehydro-3-deoxy-L-rhamnonate hydrolase